MSSYEDYRHAIQHANILVESQAENLGQSDFEGQPLSDALHLRPIRSLELLERVAPGYPHFDQVRRHAVKLLSEQGHLGLPPSCQDRHPDLPSPTPNKYKIELDLLMRRFGLDQKPHSDAAGDSDPQSCDSMSEGTSGVSSDLRVSPKVALDLLHTEPILHAEPILHVEPIDSFEQGCGLTQAPTGLSNSGGHNHCFLNTLLQVHRAVEGLKHAILQGTSVTWENMIQY